MNRLLHYLVLPREVTSFEAAYLRRINRIALVFFWLHPPVFAVVALLCETSIPLAVGLSMVAMVGPTLAYASFRERPRLVGLVYGFTAMLMGGVLVYIGQGPMQIEMHFYFFVLIALLAVFGNPVVILIAAVTVALHHLVVWLVLPRGVFNYDASFWSVAVHAIFVVLESVAACFVARSFFNNVIGLERIVTARTTALDARNRDMSLILDNVAQGFVTLGLDGSIGPERSRALVRWFGEPAPDVRWWNYISKDDNLAAWIELSFASAREGFLPIDVVLDQIPPRITRDGRHFRVQYQPLGAPPTGLLVVVTDVTDEVSRERAERAQRELIAVVERANRDRAGFATFAAEAESLVEQCVRTPSVVEQRRHLHTLKGNSALFGATSIAELCHALESVIEQECSVLEPERTEELAEAWRAFRRRVDPVLGLTKRRTIVIDWEEYQSVISSLGAPQPAWAEPVLRWGQDPIRVHLERLATQARALAARLSKPDLAVEIEDHDVRLDPDRFMPLISALVHAVRNAVDHGIETPEQRRAVGKPTGGRLTFRCTSDHDELAIEIADDGGGIDWDAVAFRARELGLAASTTRDLNEALFTSGVSTAKDLSDISGRGVGLDALRAACHRLGGRLEIESETGRGSTVRCTIPMTTPLVAREALRSTAG
jgi:two-component system, chemotaxis family, sensor kinase CheA